MSKKKYCSDNPVCLTELGNNEILKKNIEQLLGKFNSRPLCNLKTEGIAEGKTVTINRAASPYTVESTSGNWNN